MNFYANKMPKQSKRNSWGCEVSKFLVSDQIFAPYQLAF